MTVVEFILKENWKNFDHLIRLASCINELGCGARRMKGNEEEMPNLRLV